jgi:hypothetical protein
LALIVLQSAKSQRTIRSRAFLATGRPESDPLETAGTAHWLRLDEQANDQAMTGICYGKSRSDMEYRPIDEVAAHHRMTTAVSLQPIG